MGTQFRGDYLGLLQIRSLKNGNLQQYPEIIADLYFSGYKLQLQTRITHFDIDIQR